MKRVALAVVLAGCGAPPSPRPEVTVLAVPERWSDAWILEEGERYLEDASFRRAALEASLTDPDNVYSATRLSSYGLIDRGWDQLPEWTPVVHPVDASVVAQLRRGTLTVPENAARLWDGTRPTSFEGWAELGRRVFYEYPLRPEPHAGYALAHPELADAVGLSEVEGTWPGVIAFRNVDGRDEIGITCALCHVAIDDGVMVEGRARRNLDYGRMRVEWYEAVGTPLPDALAQRMLGWGLGRADITADDDEDPVAIVDLWGLRELRHLTQAATLTHEHPAALAIRQETQILHANRERTRPPRELAWALAVYLYSLEAPAAEAVDALAAARGAQTFEADCAKCHRSAVGSGDPLPAARVGTDPELAHGQARGTGMYRPAPLIGVAAAGPYLHDGTVGSLEQLLGRDRFGDEYTGPRGVGAVKGHAYGVDLEPGARGDLIAYLRSR